MKKATIIFVMLTLILTAALTLAMNIRNAQAENLWFWVMDTITGDYGEAVVGTGDAIYIARGNNFHRYDPADNSFSALTPPPNPDPYDAFKTGTALAWDFEDHIYALYGASSGNNRRWFYRYNISADSWQALSNTTHNQGEGDAITWVGIDNCIYATVGGEQRPTYLLRYDPSTDSWTDAPADPPAGMGDGASLVWTGEDSLYALRGEYDETTPLYDFWRYNLTEDTWNVMADIPAVPHSGGSGGVGDGGSLLYAGLWLPEQMDYVYALSGNQAHPDGIPDNRTYRYTISTNSWEFLSDLPSETNAGGVGHYVGCRLGYAEGHIYAWQGTPSIWPDGGNDLFGYQVAMYTVEWTPTCPYQYIPSSIPRDGEPVYVTAKILRTMDKTLLSYKVDQGRWWNTTMMYNATSSLWNCIIPAQPGGSNVTFYIQSYQGTDAYTSQMYNYTVKDLYATDLNGDSIVDMRDISRAAKDFGKIGP